MATETILPAFAGLESIELTLVELVFIVAVTLGMAAILTDTFRPAIYIGMLAIAVTLLVDMWGPNLLIALILLAIPALMYIVIDAKVIVDDKMEKWVTDDDDLDRVAGKASSLLDDFLTDDPPPDQDRWDDDHGRRP